MTYTTPTPSTVSAGDTFPASAYNIISADLQDHETRIKTGVESYTTTQKTALTGVTTGTMVYDSTLNRFETYNGTAWTLTTTPPSVTTTQKTALSSAPYAVATGTMVYDSTLGLVQVWNGAGWYAASGLVPLIAPLVNFSGSGNVANTSAEITVSSASSVILTNVFPTSITAFKVIITVTASSSNGNANLSLTNAGSVASFNTYNTAFRRGVWTPNGGASPVVTWSEGATYQPSGTKGFYVGESANGGSWNNWMTTSFDLFNPSKAQYKSVQGMAMSTAQVGTQTASLWFTGMEYDQAIADGFVFTVAGTFSGTIRVYGYVG